ncbi:hypothetical protein BGZ65_001704 [Modicella reniformis]|uniref:Arrestin-like N-terminal domain-containing protein n=1 Tax=Modicella reniformis TaxID=1440133 RepID=A0A9P6MLV7_9FUNG|nr:hypothetical protein BGZ65_001704 [Modicella reniformis]
MSGMVAKAFGRDRKNKSLTIDIETLGTTKASQHKQPPSSSPSGSSSSSSTTTIAATTVTTTTTTAAAALAQDTKKPLVLVRGTKERPGFVQATITLELDGTTEGDEVEIIFKAVIGSKVPIQGGLWDSESRSEEVLQKKRWIMPVKKAGPKTIAAGTYKHEVFTTIDPSWPSSCTTQTEGYVQYTFQAQITTTSITRVAVALLSTTQEFLVINHNLPMLPSSPSLLSPSPYPPTYTPHSTLVVSDQKSLPVQVSIPSETLMFGQSVPVTIQVHPFKEDSRFVGQEVVIMEARFRIQETRHARSTNHSIKDKLVKDIVELKVPGTSMGSWPQGRNGWKRTITIKMPSSVLDPPPSPTTSVSSFPGSKRASVNSALSSVSWVSTSSASTVSNSGPPVFLRASLKSKYYDVMHQLVISLKVRTSGEKDKQSEDVEIRLDLKIAHPMPTGTDALPEYHPVAAFSFDGDEFLTLPFPLPLHPLQHPYPLPHSLPCQQKSIRRDTFTGKPPQLLRA